MTPQSDPVEQATASDPASSGDAFAVIENDGSHTEQEILLLQLEELFAYDTDEIAIEGNSEGDSGTSECACGIARPQGIRHLPRTPYEHSRYRQTHGEVRVHYLNGIHPRASLLYTRAIESLQDAYLCSFSPECCDAMMRQHRSVMERSLVAETAYEAVRFHIERTMNQWESNCLTALERHISQLALKNAQFRDMHDFTSITAFLRESYDSKIFTRIFPQFAGNIDWKASSSILSLWCRAIYYNAGFRLKIWSDRLHQVDAGFCSSQAFVDLPTIATSPTLRFLQPLYTHDVKRLRENQTHLRRRGAPENIVVNLEG